jgi:hypothetical protein
MSLVDDGTARPDALAVLRGLIDLLANPKATLEAIDKLTAATTKADAERAAVKELKTEQAQLRMAMTEEQEAHRRQLSDERLALNNEINQRRNEVAKAEAAVEAAQTAAENDAHQAVELHARWQKKVDAIDAGRRSTREMLNE